MSFPLLSRGIVDVIERAPLEKLLQSGKKLRIKFGIDPTGSDLHLGHCVPLKKLRQFQDAGHHILLLFGTFTGKIGDPTGKDKLRKPLTDENIVENMKTYLAQAGKILDLTKTKIVKNGDWLSKMNFEEVLRLASAFTASQMMQRDMFQERLKKGLDINLVEFFYPLMQGYDSVAIKADIEMGGTDQLFNLMAGRRIQEHFGLAPQAILTVPILEGLDGHEKMSKSLNNFVGITESPREMFGKLMSIPDALMRKYFELLTDISEEEIADILAEHPREAKLTLAKRITSDFHTPEEGERAKAEFLEIFSKRDENTVPEDAPIIELLAGTYSVLDLAVKSGLFPSSTEARRKIIEGAVKIDGEKQEDPNAPVILNDGEKVFQMGKRKFCRMKV
ncbi:MAG: tyrosine--tRNA ligase [Candidatus Peregrinibacteria bacterium]